MGVLTARGQAIDQVKPCDEAATDPGTRKKVAERVEATRIHDGHSGVGHSGW
jgi:hypothetical protein